MWCSVLGVQRELQSALLWWRVVNHLVLCPGFPCIHDGTRRIAVQVTPCDPRPLQAC